MGNERNARDVGVSIFTRETKPLREVRANDIAVEHFHALSEPPQLRHQRVGDRGLSRTRQTRQPNHTHDAPPYASFKIDDTSDRVNSSGNTSPFARISRTRVPERTSLSLGACGHVFIDATLLHPLQKKLCSKKSVSISRSPGKSSSKIFCASYVP